MTPRTFYCKSTGCRDRAGVGPWTLLDPVGTQALISVVPPPPHPRHSDSSGSHALSCLHNSSPACAPGSCWHWRP